MGDLDTLLEPDFRHEIDNPFRDPEIPVFSANPMLGTADEDTFDLLGAAFVALYLAHRAAPASQGLGEDDAPVLVFRAWTPLKGIPALPIRVDSLTEEQLRQQCKQPPNVQRWVDEAAANCSA